MQAKPKREEKAQAQVKGQLEQAFFGHMCQKKKKKKPLMNKGLMPKVIFVNYAINI